ncbi:hypothetical protein LTR28_003323 [Elasticomyces elasticus]|nr:hypothetical protein LTR28_003323 [Elasticomyces elasticus]
MYQFNARSPCPAPIGSTHSKASWNSTFDLSALEDDTCNVEYTREILVRDNIQRQRMGAPRRPKRAVDIQIHVDRTRERDEKVNPALNGSHEENASALLDISTAYVPPQRATLAQPAQRFRLRPLAAAKRETKSAVQDDRTTSSPRNLRTLPTDRTQKDLRRRTIYIPEDTTIMTIHPGTLLSEDRNLDDHIRQRDRASLVLEGKCEPGANQHEVETEIVKAGRPRKSLAVAPRRIPLQQTTPKQMTSLLIDVAGYDTVTLHKRICASLSYGALSIPKATIEKLRLQDDLGSRRRFLDFWLDTYDWTILQPALEAVIGREMAKPTQDSEIARCKSKTIRRLFDKKGLESFLETFLICTGDVVRTRRASGCIKATVHRTKHNSEDVGLEVWSWQQTMLRSLMLIYLLDKAKSEAIFTRCLFRPEAVYKSSLAVLQALGARLTPSIGDITRHLKHLNYDVGYVQYPLQEYVYRITNVAVDLRDGVLLTRLVELLCCHPAGLPPYEVQIHDGSPSWALSQYLKFPCLGRAQKLYNVQIALDALSDCVSSISIADGVKAEDIVDGHREKTLGLLWSLVSRFGFCKLLDLVDFTQEVEKWRQNKKGLGTRTSKSSQPDAAQNMVAYKELLQVWAREVCRTKDILVTNLTTSYTDGKVFATIVSAYTNSILPPGSLPTSPGAAAAQLQTSLRVLGCSLSFVKLLACDKSTIPTQETTLATLALLAARILPRIRAYRAAATIQRAVRLRIARQTITRRVMLMHLAHDCATVVETRERLVLATSLLQRRWREVLAVRRMRLDTMVEVFQVVAKGWLARRAVQGNVSRVMGGW